MDAWLVTRVCWLQDDNDKADVHNIMEGLRAAAAAVQAGEFSKAYGHLLEQPQSAPAEVLEQLKRAQEVCCDSFCSPCMGASVNHRCFLSRFTDCSYRDFFVRFSTYKDAPMS